MKKFLNRPLVATLFIMLPMLIVLVVMIIAWICGDNNDCFYTKMFAVSCAVSYLVMLPIELYILEK